MALGALGGGDVVVAFVAAQQVEYPGSLPGGGYDELVVLVGGDERGRGDPVGDLGDDMSIEDIIDLVRSWDGALAVTPEPGDDAPEIAWGDTFFYYAPDGNMPARTQPFATIVTKNYPDDETSRLDRPGVFRVNIAARRGTVRTLASDENSGDATDPSALDRVFVHPVYGSMGWLAVMNPGPRTSETTRGLIRQAYEAARARHDRRRQTS